MPFPLAHPAAVLPLRRFCPRILSFPALIVGSLVPDAGYLFPGSQANEFAHSLPGLLGFALPAGLLVLLVLYVLRSRLFRMVPAPFKQVTAPVCLVPPSPLRAVVLSILIGAATHLAWDSFTHKDGWLVEHAAFLRFPVLAIGRRTARLCHVLWYLSTFAGLAWLMMAGLDWLQSADASRSSPGFNGRLASALLFAAVMIPVAIVHHLIGSLFGDLILLLLAALLSLAFALWLGKAAPRGG